MLKRSWLSAQHASLIDPSSTWFQRWYFELRLTEEIYRCQRYGQLTTVIVIEFAPECCGRSLEQALAKIAEEGLRLVDIPGRIESHEYGICLPHTGGAGAQVIADRLKAQLSRFSPRMGCAVFGEDGRTIWELLSIARSRAQEDESQPTPLEAA